MKKQIFHLRAKNFSGGMTVVSTYNPVENTTTIQYSICSIKDSYNKKMGVKLAQASTTGFTVTGEIKNAKHLTSTLFNNLDDGTAKTALKSIFHSMFGFKITKSVMEGLVSHYFANAMPQLTTQLFNASISTSNVTSLKEIIMLHDLIPLLADHV